MNDIVTSLHGREIGLDAQGKLVVRNGILGLGYVVNNVAGNGVVDDTDAIQDAIDALPASGGEIILGNGTFMVSGIRLDGSDGSKTNVTLRGQGRSTILKKLAHSSMTTEAQCRASVVSALYGHGHCVRDLDIIGNYGRGGVSPPYAARWVLGQTWGSSGTVYSVASDGTAGTQTTTDRIVVVTVTGAGQTSSGSNISVDIGAGYVTEVTDQPWNEVAGTGYLNAYYVDDSYAYRHGIYMNGTTEAMEDCLVHNVRVSLCMYGGILLGSGPLFAANTYFGTLRGRISSCHAASNRGSNIGGGFGVYRAVTNCTIYAGASSGIRYDEGCLYGSITNCVINGNDSQANGGIDIYKSHGTVISGNTINNAAPGIWVQESDHVEVVGNHVRSSQTNGMSINDSNFAVISGNQCRENNGHGIQVSNGKHWAVTGNVCYANGDSGIKFVDAAQQGSCTGNTCVNNSTDGGTVNAGINAEACTLSVFTGNRCTDTRAGGSRTQNYGINENGASSNNVFGLNILTNNLLGELATVSASMSALNLDGTATDVDALIDPRGAGLLKVGTYTAGAATDSTGYITIKDAGGTSRKLMVQA